MAFGISTYVVVACLVCVRYETQG